MNVSRTTTLWLAIAFLVSQADLGISAAQNTNETNVSVAARLQQISTMDISFFNESKCRRMQAVLLGIEDTAVAYAFSNYMSKTSSPEMKETCMAIMIACETNTFTHLEAITKTKGELSLDLQWTALQWARYVKARDAFLWVIDHTIESNVPQKWPPKEEMEKWPVEMDIHGPPYRPCDLAFDLIYDKVDGAQALLGRVPISELDDIAVRDEKLKLCKTWWKQNKDFLEWSDKQNTFIINRDAANPSVPKSPGM
jgi:hypothetical protein